MKLDIRPYQHKAIDAFANRKIQRGLITLPTGTGKTVTGAAIAKAIGGRVLWIAHREELITQPLKTLRVVWPELWFGAGPGIVKAGRNEWARQFVLASVQTACRDSRLAQLSAKPWDLVVIDEAHHAPAASYRKVLEAVGVFRDGGPSLLGLTATPERADNVRLDSVFEGVLYQYHLAQAVAEGYLAPPSFAHRSIGVDLDGVGRSGGDFKQGELDVALLEAGIVDEVVAAYLEHATSRKTIVFTVSVKQAESIAEKLRGLGHAAAAVSGETPADRRRTILADLASGKLKVVVNCMVLTEGFDEPTVSCIIMARPTQSKSLYIQCVGRGLRLAPMKDDCLIVDMVGVSKRHNMVQAPVIFGADLAEAEDREEGGGVSDAREYWRIRLSAQAAGVDEVSRSALKWIRGGDGVFLLGVGDYGTVRMSGQGDEWDLEVVGNRVAGEDRITLTDAPVDPGLAQGIAEDYVRRCNATRISNGGRWRDHPATQAQLGALRKWKIDPPAGITRGEASDMLTAVAAKKYEPATVKQLSYLRHLGVDAGPKTTKAEARRMIAQAKAAQ